MRSSRSGRPPRKTLPLLRRPRAPPTTFRRHSGDADEGAEHGSTEEGDRKHPFGPAAAIADLGEGPGQRQCGSFERVTSPRVRFDWSGLGKLAAMAESPRRALSGLLLWSFRDEPGPRVSRERDLAVPARMHPEPRRPCPACRTGSLCYTWSRLRTARIVAIPSRSACSKASPSALMLVAHVKIVIERVAGVVVALNTAARAASRAVCVRARLAPRMSMLVQMPARAGRAAAWVERGAHASVQRRPAPVPGRSGLSWW